MIYTIIQQLQKKISAKIADFPVLKTAIKFRGSKAPYLHKGILEGVSPRPNPL